MHHRTVIVATFDGDRTGATAAAVEQFLSQVQVDRRPWFDVRRGGANRRMSPDVALTAFNSARIDDGAVYTGQVTQEAASEDRYTEERSRCAEYESGGGLLKKCLRTETYTVPCLRRTAQYEAVIRVLSARLGRVVHSVGISGTADDSGCDARVGSVASREALVQEARTEALSALSCEFAPCIRMQKLEPMGSPEGLTTEQARVRFVEAYRYAIDSEGAGMGPACSEWLALAGGGERTIPLFYNIAICLEINGEYQEAMDYLNRAKSLSVGLHPELEDALRRLQDASIDNAILQGQKQGTASDRSMPR